MELEWIFKAVPDGEGNTIRNHYLVDSANQQCLAIVPEPRDGQILYVTDIRIAGYDRSFMTLEAAKAYCEWNAEQENIKAVEELQKATAGAAQVEEAKPERERSMLEH